MLLIGSLYAAGAVLETGAARWVVVVSVFLFGIVFCATWGIVSKIYASEIQPSHTRAAGNSVGMAFSFVSLASHVLMFLLRVSEHALFANNYLRLSSSLPTGLSHSSHPFC